MAVNGRQCFLLALLAMVVNALWVWRAMVVNGFATAWLWGWSLMLRAKARCGWVRGCSSYVGIWALLLAWVFVLRAVFCACALVF